MPTSPTVAAGQAEGSQTRAATQGISTSFRSAQEIAEAANRSKFKVPTTRNQTKFYSKSGKSMLISADFSHGDNRITGNAPRSVKNARNGP